MMPKFNLFGFCIHIFCLVLMASLVISSGAGGIPRCSRPGHSEVTCFEECHEHSCWQKTVVEKCSCSGFKSRLEEMATFGLDGKLKTAPAFGFIAECDKCSDRCANLAKHDQTKRRYVRDARKSQDCSKHGDRSVSLGTPVNNDDLESGSDLETVEVGPPLIKGHCNNPGNLTRLCIEKCQLDGKTCSMEVRIDACTCGKRRLQLFESAKYDMKTKKRVFLGTSYENNGYSRVCGDCTDFCAFRAGERNEYHVNTLITTCFDASKLH